MSSPSDWQVTKQKVIQRGKHIMETGQWSDCKFIVGQEPYEQILEAHKLFLAMSSPVFEAMFFGNMAEKKNPIPIEDVHPEAFNALLEYIYTDNINLSSFELACQLCYCARKYMLPFLAEECTKFLVSKVSPQTACRAYELAKLLDEPVLMKECLEIICTETNNVLSEPNFEEIEFGTLEMVFDQTKLKIDSEIELFSAAERWARSECSRKGLDPEDCKLLRSVIGNVWTKIRFLTLTPQKFADGPARSSLLTKDEAFAILMNISSSESKWPMPDGFSTNAQSRVRLTDRYDCQIPLSALIDPTNRNIAVSSFSFTVNKDITVIGVQVLTGNSSCFVRSFNTQLLDPNELVLTEKNCAVPHHQSYVEVMFDGPVDIQRNKVYRIKVEFECAIHFYLSPYLSQTTCGPVLFSLGAGSDMSNSRVCLIRSIIFRY